jgi:hypothetical protein
VLLDTSAGMSSHYRENSDYLIGPFLREFLRIGDTFHLISFSELPRLEISRRIENIGDMETIIARLLLMYPLNPQSNLGDALSFAERYSISLPGNRSSKLVLLSDGSAPNTQNLVNTAQGRLSNQGVDFQFIQVPVTGTGPSSGRPIIAGTPPQAGQPVIPPAVPGQAVPPAQVQQPTPGAAPPPSQQEAPRTGDQAVTAPGQPTQVQAPVQAAPPVAVPAQEPGRTLDLPLPLLIALGILALIILGLLIIFAARRLQESPNRAMASAAAPVDSKDAELMSTYAQKQKSQARPPLEHRPVERKPLPKDKTYDDSAYIDSGPIMLNLFVQDQNTAIGRRNIHTVKSGFSFTIGGGKSDFLIFLVPFPPSIANVHYDGRNCTFVPLKPGYFPDIGSQSVTNCIGKTIRVISDKNYEIHLRIERYEDPLKVLNKLLNSISVPGPVK